MEKLSAGNSTLSNMRSNQYMDPTKQKINELKDNIRSTRQQLSESGNLKDLESFQKTVNFLYLKEEIEKNGDIEKMSSFVDKMSTELSLITKEKETIENEFERTVSSSRLSTSSAIEEKERVFSISLDEETKKLQMFIEEKKKELENLVLKKTKEFEEETNSLKLNLQATIAEIEKEKDLKIKAIEVKEKVRFILKCMGSVDLLLQQSKNDLSTSYCF